MAGPFLDGATLLRVVAQLFLAVSLKHLPERRALGLGAIDENATAVVDVNRRVPVRGLASGFKRSGDSPTVDELSGPILERATLDGTGGKRLAGRRIQGIFSASGTTHGPITPRCESDWSRIGAKKPNELASPRGVEPLFPP